MPLAITDDHRALAAVARSFLAGQRAAARALLDAPDEPLPAVWKEIAALGWLGLHVPEVHGGEGAGLPELAVVLEELGRVVAPGPFLPSVLRRRSSWRRAPPSSRPRCCPASPTDRGSAPSGWPQSAGGEHGGQVRDELVLGGGHADVVLLVVGDDVLVTEEFERSVPAKVLDRTRRARSP